MRGVDVRDTPEVEKSGKVAGALHVSRGMLEFRADPESPYHDKNFTKDKGISDARSVAHQPADFGKVMQTVGRPTNTSWDAEYNHAWCKL